MRIFSGETARYSFYHNFEELIGELGNACIPRKLSPSLETAVQATCKEATLGGGVF